MLRPPPDPEELARWLLSHDAEEQASSTALVACAERAHIRLRASLSIFFGQAGFDSLWARALSLAQLSITDDAAAPEVARMLRTAEWTAVINRHTESETRDVVIAAFTSFVALLFKFVGAELGARLIYQAWSELPPDATGRSTGDAAS